MATLEQIGTTQDGAEVLRLVCSLEREPCAEVEGQASNQSWVHILPDGVDVTARDGRAFTVPDLDAVIRASELPLLVDWEHRSEFTGDTRAAGWIEEFKVEPPSAGARAGTWGRVRWTKAGDEDTAGLNYRYLSPVVVGKRAHAAGGKSVLSVTRIASVALTNRPALRMQKIEALREQLSVRVGHIAAYAGDDEGETMSRLQTAVRQAYSLRDDATDEQLAAAFERAREQGGETATLREALSTVTQERNEAQAALTDATKRLDALAADAFKGAVQAFFDEGARKGKIPPAARTKWLDFALKSSEQFETFKTLIYPDLPVVVGDRAPPSKAKKPAGATEGGRTALSENGVDRGALRRLGFTAQQIRDAEADVFGQDGGPGDDDDDDDDDEDDNPAPGDDAGGKEGATP